MNETEICSLQPKAVADLVVYCVLSRTEDLADKVDLTTPLTRATELELVAYFRSWLRQPADNDAVQTAVQTTLQGSEAEQAARADMQRCLCWLLLVSLLRHDPELGSQCLVMEVVETMQKIRPRNGALFLPSPLTSAPELIVAAVGKALVRLAAEAACRGSSTDDHLFQLCSFLILELDHDQSTEHSVQPGTLQAILCSDAASALLLTKLLASKEGVVSSTSLLFRLLRKAAYLDSASPAQLELCGRLLKPTCAYVPQLVDLLARAKTGDDAPGNMRLAILVLPVLATMSEHPLAAPVMRAAKLLPKAQKWPSLRGMPAAQALAFAKEQRTSVDIADPAAQCMLLLSRLPEDAHVGARYHFDAAIDYLRPEFEDETFPDGRQVAARVLKAAMPATDIDDIIKVPNLTLLRTFRSCWETFPDLREPTARMLRQIAVVKPHYVPPDKAAIWAELAQMIQHASLRNEDLPAWLDLVSFMSIMLRLHGSQAAAMRPILCSGGFFAACVRVITSLQPAADDTHDAVDAPGTDALHLKLLVNKLQTILTKSEFGDPEALPLFELMAVRIFDTPTYGRAWLLNPITAAFHDMFARMLARTEDEPEHCKEFATAERVRSTWDLLVAIVDDGIMDEQLNMLAAAGTAAKCSTYSEQVAAVVARIEVTAELMTSAWRVGINLTSLELPHMDKVARALLDVPAGALPSMPWSKLAVQLAEASLKFLAATFEAEMEAVPEAVACPDALLGEDGSRLPPMRMHSALAVVRLMECMLETLHGKHEAHGGRAQIIRSVTVNSNRRSYKIQGTSTKSTPRVEQVWMGKLAGLVFSSLHWHWQFVEGAQQLLRERQAGPVLAALLRQPPTIMPISSVTRSRAHMLLAQMAEQDQGRAAANASALLEEEAASTSATRTPVKTRKQKQRRARNMPLSPAASPEPALSLRENSSSAQPPEQPGVLPSQPNGSAPVAMPLSAAAQPPVLSDVRKDASYPGSTGFGAGGGAAESQADEANAAQSACQAAKRSLGSPVEGSMLLGSAARATVIKVQDAREPEPLGGSDHSPHAGSSASSDAGEAPAGYQVNEDTVALDNDQACGSWPGRTLGASTSAPGSAGGAVTQAQQASSWHACLHVDTVQLHEDLCCPITQELMQDPVIADDGHTYERYAIEAWLAKTGTSPMTGLPLEHDDLIPNIALQHFLQKCVSFGYDAG